MQSYLILVDIIVDIFPVLAIIYFNYQLWKINKSNQWSALAKKFQLYYTNKIFFTFSLITGISLIFKSLAFVKSMSLEHPATIVDVLEIISDLFLSVFMVYLIFSLHKLGVASRATKK